MDVEAETKGMVDLSASEDKEEFGRLVTELKTEVNEFLFSRLPSSTTLGEFDAMAVRIHDEVLGVWFVKGFEYEESTI